MEQKSILITGCSTGIGLASTKLLASKNWQVFATARRDEDLKMLSEIENVIPVYLEYRDEQSIKDCAEYVLKQTGGKLFALFNNGAYGQPGAIEDIETKFLRDQFEVNFFGWHELTRLIIPAMRAQNDGRIIQCSSVLGFVSAPYRGAYCASKFALEALTDAMRLELAKTNIKVSLIEPGPIRTAFVDTALEAYRQNVDLENSAHRQTYKARLEQMEKGGKARFKLEPDVVAQKLLHAVTSRRPKRRYYVTIPTYVMAYAKRILPVWVLDKILVNN